MVRAVRDMGKAIEKGRRKKKKRNRKAKRKRKMESLCRVRDRLDPSSAKLPHESFVDGRPIALHPRPSSNDPTEFLALLANVNLGRDRSDGKLFGQATLELQLLHIFTLIYRSINVTYRYDC